MRENNVVPIEPVLVKIKIRPNKPSSPEIQRTQFPLTLAYACLVVSFELIKQKAFNYGQINVALSRATSLNGLYILGQIESKHLKADARVHQEYERLRHISLLKQANETHIQNSADVTVCLLNIRSLRKHSIDIKYDTRVFDSDILFLTETQLLPQSYDTEIRNHLSPFTLFRQDHPSDRYCSLALGIKPMIEVKEHEYFPHLNAVKFELLNKNADLHLTSLLLYRQKNYSNILQFVQDLGYVLTTCNIDIILGDFNINYLHDDSIRPLESLLSSFGYSQIVQSPTFISAGSMLDQAYIKTSHLDIVQNSVLSVYYSDHDAVQASLKMKKK